MDAVPDGKRFKNTDNLKKKSLAFAAPCFDEPLGYNR